MSATAARHLSTDDADDRGAACSSDDIAISLSGGWRADGSGRVLRAFSLIGESGGDPVEWSYAFARTRRQRGLI